MNTLLPLVGLAGAIAPGPADCAKKDSRPDIIFIMTDQQTLQAMSCMGNPYVKTPAMDSLAGDGVLLQRAYCPFPLSGPCRASLITGLTPFQTGATDNAIRPVQWALDAGIGNRMSQAGYECLYAGKWHAPEINVPQGSGFTKLCDMDDRLIASACADGIANRDKSKPLFLVASYLDPHEICEFARDATLPYGSLDPFETSACPPLPANFAQSEHTAEALERERQAAPMWHDTYSYSQNDWRRYVYGYYRLVERVDRRIGDLLKVLKKNGLYENSLIIFCSDHGDGVAAHGWNQKWALYEECINIPLIVKAPKAHYGVKNDQALSNIGLDIYATVCDYAGIALDKDVYLGQSLRVVAEQKSQTLHESVVVETYLSAVDLRGWCIIEGDWKYVLYQFLQDREGLYNLSEDKGEMNNLAYDSSYRDKLDSMRAELYKYAVRAGDPKLKKQLGPLMDEIGRPTGHVKGNR